MKTILMASDLSARSDRALDRSARLADQHRARLVVLHVVDEEQRAAVIDHLVEAAKRAIDSDLAARVSPQVPGVSVDVRVEVGRVFSDIHRYADELDADLIVLGTHRTESLEDLFRGTTADRLLRTGHRPVLLVKDPSHQPYARVLVAVDFSIYSRRAIEMALKLAQPDALHLLHVYHVPFSAFLDGRDTRQAVRQDHLDRMNAMIDEELNALTARTSMPALQFKKIIREGEVRAVIREEADRLAPDLLVVGTHGRTGVGHALLGSVAEDLLRDPPCDVLAVKAW